MTQISISFDQARITERSIADLLEAVGFGSASIYLSVHDFRDRFFCPGTIGVFAVEIGTQRLIGMARAFSDDIFTSYVSELCVLPEYQQKGIGSGLVGALVERLGHTAIFADAFRDHVATFEKHAITPKAKLVACSRRPHVSDPVTH